MTVNKNLYDWQSIEIVLPNGVSIGLTEINYSDERPIEARYGKGGIPRGYGRKNYKATADATMDKDEFERLRKFLGGSTYTKTPFVIVVSFANHDQPITTDTLRDCMVTKVNTGVKKEEDNTGVVKLDLEVLSPIEWNGVPAYSAGRDGAPGN